METPFSSGSFLSTQFMSGDRMQYFPDRGYLTQPEMGNFRQTPGPQYPQALNQLGFMGAMFHGYPGTNTMDNYVMGADSHKFGMMARRKVQDSTAAMAGSILDQALKMAVGGIVTVATGGNVLAGMAAYSMTPSISSPFTDRLRQARNIQYQTMSKVIGGSDMDQGLGQGFSLQAAGRMDQSIRRMAASDSLLKEKDYRKLMEMGIEGGMFDYSLSSAQYTGKLKNLIGNFKAMMEMLETADPKLIQDTMTRLQRMGASTDQMIPMVAKEQLAARMLGIQHSEMINTYGQQGAMLYGSAGLTPYAGIHENVGNVANAALAQRLGLIDPSRMARLGGIGAIGQRATQETANMLNSTAAQGIMYTMLDSNMDFDPSKLGEMLASNEDMRGRLNKGMQAYSDMTKNNTLKHVQMQKKMATNKAKLGEYLSQEGLADEYKMKLYESVGATVDPALDYWGRVEMGMWAISDLPAEQQDTQLKIWKSPEFQKQLKNQKIVNREKQVSAKYEQEAQKESWGARAKVALSKLQFNIGDYLYGKSTDWHEKTDGLFGTKPPAYVNSWEGGIGSVFGRGSSGGSGRNLIREITGKDITEEEKKLLLEMAVKEGRGRPEAEQAAIIHTALKRLRELKKRKPEGTLKDVLMHPFAYSPMTDPKDPQYKKTFEELRIKPSTIAETQGYVDRALSGYLESPVPNANMFHAVTKDFPNGYHTDRWGAISLGQIGATEFYLDKEEHREPQYGPRVPTPKRPVNRLGQMDMSWVNDKAPVEFTAAKATWMEARSVGSQVKGMGTPTGDYRGQSRESIITALIDAANASGATTAAALENTVIEELSVLMRMRSADVMADPELSKLIEIALSRTEPHVQDILKGSAQRYNVKNTENYIRGVNKVQNESLGKINELATNTYGGGIRDMLGKPQTSNALEVLTALTMSKSIPYSKGEDRESNKRMLGQFKKATGLDGLTDDILSDPAKLGAYLKQQGWTDGDIEVVISAADAKSDRIRGDKKSYDALNTKYFDAKTGYAKGVVVSEEAELELGLRNVAGITEDGSLIDKLFGDGGKDRAKSLMDSLGKNSPAYSVLDEISRAKSKEEFLSTTKHLNDLDDAARGKGNVPSEGRNNEPTKVEQDQLDLGKQTKEVLNRLDSTLVRVETELKIMNDKKVGPFKHKYNLVEGLTE